MVEAQKAGVGDSEIAISTDSPLFIEKINQIFRFYLLLLHFFFIYTIINFFKLFDITR